MDDIENELIGNSNVLKTYNFPFLYKYYVCKGYWNFILQQISNITITVSIGVITTLLFLVKWSELIYDYKLNFKSIDVSFWSFMLVGNLFFIAIFCAWFMLYLFTSFKSLYHMNQLVSNTLTVDHSEFIRMTWKQVIYRLAERHACDPETLLQNVNSIIMKNDNFMIYLVRNNKIDLNIGSRRLPFTSISTWAIKQLVCDAANVSEYNFRKTSRLMGIGYTLLIPFTIISIIIYVLIKQAEQFHAKQSRFSPRNWTQYACSMFQNLNELPHLFRKRLMLSSMHADKYMSNHQYPIVITLARNMSFLSGAIMSIIMMVALINEDAIMNIYIADRNLLSYMYIFTAIFAASRYAIPNPQNLLVNSTECIRDLATCLEFDSESTNDWVENAESDRIYRSLTSFYRYRIVILLREILSFILLPYMFFIILPKNHGNILDAKRSYNSGII